MCHDPHDEAIIRAVVDLSKSFGFKVVAEGVETADQLDCQRMLGCHAAQGYLVGRPMAEIAFSDLIAGLPMVDRMMSELGSGS
jgi:EAL domain-containing protein (putative c-di-GMP-specific phosphodiesterase class I)